METKPNKLFEARANRTKLLAERDTIVRLIVDGYRIVSGNNTKPPSEIVFNDHFKSIIWQLDNNQYKIERCNEVIASLLDSTGYLAEDVESYRKMMETRS